jgi:addiction module RelE/StbE family toxin
MDKKLQKKFKERLVLFFNNPNDPLLKNHPLKGDLVGFRAFSITGDVRVIYKVISQKEVRFTDIGTHNQVY